MVMELKTQLFAIIDYKLIIILLAATLLMISVNVCKAQIVQITTLSIVSFIVLTTLVNPQGLIYIIMAFIIITLVVFEKIIRLPSNKKNMGFKFLRIEILPALFFYNINNISYYKIILFIQQNVVFWQILLLAALNCLLFFLITLIINFLHLKPDLRKLNKNLGYILSGLPFFVRLRQKAKKVAETEFYNEKTQNKSTQSIQKQNVETQITPINQTNQEKSEKINRPVFYIQEKNKLPKIKVVRTEKKLSCEERTALDLYLADANNYLLTYIKGELHDAEKTGEVFPKDLFDKLPHHPAVFKLGEQNINRSLTSTIPSQGMEYKHKFLVVTWGILCDIDGNTTNVITKYWQKTYNTNEVIYVSENLILKYFLTPDEELNKKNKQIIDEKTETHIRWVLERPAVEEEQRIKNQENLKKKFEEKVNKKSIITQEYHKKQEIILTLEREKKMQARKDKLKAIKEEERLKQLNNKWENVLNETKKSANNDVKPPLFPQNKNNKDETDS